MLGAPTLLSLLPKAEAQMAASNLRFVILNNWYGRDYRKWYAHDDKPVTRVTADGGYAYRTLSDLPGDISAILPSSVWDASLRKKMIMIRGLDCVQNHDGHNTTMATSASVGAGMTFGYSIDSVIEDSSAFYPVAPSVRAIRGSPVDRSWNLEASLSTFSWTSKSGRTTEITSYTWPHTIYQKYFSKVVVDAAAQRAARLQVVTNSVYEDYRRVINNQKVSSDDRKRLDDYMQLLSQAEKKLGVRATQTGGVCAAPASAASLPKDYTQYPSSDYIYAAFRDLMTAALACGMTKLAMLNHMLLGNDFLRDGTGNDKFHDCAHNPDGQKYGFPAVNMNRYLYDHNARFLKQLDSVMDTNGNTLLDNTIVYMGNDDSTGAHQLYDMPVLLAGGKGVLRTDMMIDYRSKTKGPAGIMLGRPYNNLLVTLFKSLGLGPEVYKVTANQKGFGYVTTFVIPQEYAYLKDYYAPFMTDAAKDEVLPNILLKS